MVIEHEKSSKVGIHTEWEKLVKDLENRKTSSLWSSFIEEENVIITL